MNKSVSKIKDFIFGKDEDEEMVHEPVTDANQQKISYFKSAKIRRDKDELKEQLDLRKKWILK